MKIRLILSILLWASFLQAEEFDFIFVHKAECYNFSEDSIDYCRIVNNQKEIYKLNDALEKSRSNQYLCGYEYSFEFVKKNRIVKSVWIQPSCEKNKLLNIISPYFPNRTDSFFVYLKAFPASRSSEEVLSDEIDTFNILIADDRELRRWPKIEIHYRFEQTWKSFEESLKKRDAVEKQWKKRGEYFDSLARATWPNRVFYEQEEPHSGGGPKKDYKEGYIKVRVYEERELEKIKVFDSIPEITEKKTIISEKYELLLISRELGLNENRDDIRLLNCKQADDK